jgi:hypothetical protein
MSPRRTKLTRPPSAHRRRLANGLTWEISECRKPGNQTVQSSRKWIDVDADIAHRVSLHAITNYKSKSKNNKL